MLYIDFFFFSYKIEVFSSDRIEIELEKSKKFKLYLRERLIIIRELMVNTQREST